MLFLATTRDWGGCQRKLWNTLQGVLAVAHQNHSAYLLSDGFAVELVVYLPDSRHCQGGHGQCIEAEWTPFPLVLMTQETGPHLQIFCIFTFQKEE